MTTLEPRIYVACLAAYNNAFLHGQWIDLLQPLEEVLRAVHDMLKASPIPMAEEWAIHDYEGFGGYHVEEYSSIERLHAVAAFFDVHGELGAAVLSHVDSDLEQATQTMEESYMGEYKSLADYAQEFYEQCHSVPETLAYYIDWSAMARDMEYSGDVFTIELGFEEIHVFLSQ